MWTGQRVPEKKGHRAARDGTCALVCGFCSLCRELTPMTAWGGLWAFVEPFVKPIDVAVDATGRG